jgi:flagellar capping protein FliD
MPPDEALRWLVQAGGFGAGIVFLLAAFKSGWLATRQEVDAWKSRVEAAQNSTRQEIEAWKSQADRAERRVDTLLPALDKLAAQLAEKLRER